MAPPYNRAELFINDMLDSGKKDMDDNESM